MGWSQSLRARCLGSLLRGLARIHVRPDHITVLSLLAGLLFLPLYASYPGIAVACLVWHVLLDGLDGPLARHLGIASRCGSFTDTMADQVVVAASTVALMVHGSITPFAGITYVFAYTLVVAFAMIRNAMSAPYSWLVRPRFMIYGWIVVETWLWPGTLEFVLWTFNGILLIKLLSGFLRIRQLLGQLTPQTPALPDGAPQSETTQA